MPRYRVKLVECYDVIYEVDAEDAAKALEKAISGEAQQISHEFQDFLEDQAEVTELTND